MKRRSDDLNAALLLARELAEKICRCGHVDDEHLMFENSTRCAAEGCHCRAFTPAPLYVNWIEGAR